MVPKVGLVGINGFGARHGKVILDLMQRGDIECTAFADIRVDPENEIYKGLVTNGAKHYTDYEEMLNNHDDLTFVVIATPIALHRPMAVNTLRKGFNVLLEKPPAVTIQDVDEIIETSRDTGKLCAVNFQNTSLRSFLQLNDMIEQGELGDIDRVVGVGILKRTDDYYERTPWAGKLIHNGNYVLDGTINNPLAHILNNCLIVAGRGDSKKAVPSEVQAELYKGHKIEGEDTACVRICTDNDVEILFYTTLCHKTHVTPYIVVHGTKGKAIWTYENTLKIQYIDGKDVIFSYGREMAMENIYYNLIAVDRGAEERLFSSIEDCRSFVLASNGAFESCQRVIAIPDEHIVREKEDNTIATYIYDIDKIILQASQSGKLFSELPVKWAVSTERFSLDGYSEFNLFTDK